MIGTLTIFNRETYILIDPGSTLSLISRTFAMHTNQEMMLLYYTLGVPTPVSDFVLAKSVFQDCAVLVGNGYMVADLITLYICDLMLY